MNQEHNETLFKQIGDDLNNITKRITKLEKDVMLLLSDIKGKQ